MEGKLSEVVGDQNSAGCVQGLHSGNPGHILTGRKTGSWVRMRYISQASVHK